MLDEGLHYVVIIGLKMQTKLNEGNGKGFANLKLCKLHLALCLHDLMKMHRCMKAINLVCEWLQSYDFNRIIYFNTV